MDNQDWNEVIINGKKSKAQNIRDGNYTAEYKHHVDRHAQKMDKETENFEHKKVSRTLAQSIQQARAGKRWTQKELAQHLNVKADIIAKYESGKAIPNNALLQKMSRVLGVTLSNKK